MNTDLADARSLARDVVDQVGDPGAVKVVVCPPYISLRVVADVIESSQVELGAQNMHEEDSGAYTGEVSGPMLRSTGCEYVILGHSERRQYFGESDAGVNAKIRAAQKHGLIPIVCVGETLDERKAGNAERVVGGQLSTGLDGITVDDAELLVIAYEPVWAIGTGETATPDQAQEMHAFIRSRLHDQFGSGMGADIHILYGGSVKPNNAAELFEREDVDGGLIGGASLNGSDFAEIVRAAR